MTDFKTLLFHLGTADVEFIVVGGAAGIAHGAARLTHDLDVVYRRTQENISRIVAAMLPLSPYLRDAPPGLPFLWDAKTVQRGLNFTLTTSAGEIDLLGEITGGGSFEQLLPHCVTLELYSRPVQCLGLDKLIVVKRAAGRAKDFQAIAELESLREEQGRS